MKPSSIRNKRKQLAKLGLPQPSIDKMKDWQLGPKLGELYNAIKNIAALLPQTGRVTAPAESQADDRTDQAQPHRTANSDASIAAE